MFTVTIRSRRSPDRILMSSLLECEFLTLLWNLYIVRLYVMSLLHFFAVWFFKAQFVIVLSMYLWFPRCRLPGRPCGWCILLSSPRRPMGGFAGGFWGGGV